MCIMTLLYVHIQKWFKMVQNMFVYDSVWIRDTGTTLKLFTETNSQNSDKVLSE